MSRSGRIPINVPDNAEVRVDNGIFYAKGALGELEFNYDHKAKVVIENNFIFLIFRIIVNVKHVIFYF